MPDLPTAGGVPDQHQRFERTRIELALTHLGLDRVLGGGVRGLAAWQNRDLGVGVAELQIVERFQLRSEVTISIVDPAVVNATAFEDGHVGMVEARELLEILCIERRIVGPQPRLDGGSVRDGLAARALPNRSPC